MGSECCTEPKDRNEIKKETMTVILLAAGTGSRMNSAIRKPHIEINGKPILWYTLHAFQNSPIDQIILTVSPGTADVVRKEMIEPGGFNKVKLIIDGGKERYNSVYAGLLAGKEHFGSEILDDESYVLIHDAARAFLTLDMIECCIDYVRRYKACMLGVPVKDTIRIVDEEHLATRTPPRKTLWIAQTPQCFMYREILAAYELMMKNDTSNVTDDGMVMEKYGTRMIHMVEGGYDNIKITTPEDLIIGEAIIRSRLDG